MAVSYQLVIDCAAPETLARFWAEALHYVVAPPPPGYDTWDDFYRSIGVPDEEFGEQVKAIVQAADGVVGDDALAARLVAHCRQLLAGYKAPRSVDFVAEVPRSAAGKIVKGPLREPYWAGHDRRI